MSRLLTLLGKIGKPRVLYPFIYLTNSWQEWWYSLYRFFAPWPESQKTIAQFEHNFTRINGRKHAVSFGSGRMAFYSILKALDFEPGAEIIVPAFTCVVVPNAIRYAGYKPVYVDIDCAFCIDLEHLKTLVTPKTRAICVQHTFGLNCASQELLAFAKERSIPLLEDCAHAPLCDGDGKVGKIGLASYFSLDRSKYINTVLGGIATTDDENLAQKLRSLQTQTKAPSWRFLKKMQMNFVVEFLLTWPQVYWLGRFVIRAFSILNWRVSFPDELANAQPGYYPCTMSSYQAALGNMQLANIDGITKQRMANAQQMKTIAGDHNPNLPHLRYSLFVKDPATFYKQAAFSIEAARWFTSPVHGRNEDWEQVEYFNTCPKAEVLATHIVNLPTLFRGMQSRHLHHFVTDIFAKTEGINPLAKH